MVHSMTCRIDKFLSQCVRKDKESNIFFSLLWKRYILWSYDNHVKMHLSKAELRKELERYNIKVVTMLKRLHVKGYSI